MLKTINYKNQLNISDKALVICRHGGGGTFDISYVHDAVFELLEKYNEDQLHFIFLNTNKFKLKLLNYITTKNDQKDLDRNEINNKYFSKVHFLKGTTSIEEKERYYQSCDAMLHARVDGETFGLSVGIYI